MKKLALCVLVLAMALPGSALADDASHEQAVRRFFEVSHARQMMAEIRDQCIDLISSNLEEQLGAAAAATPEGQEALEIVKEEIGEWVADLMSWERLEDIYVDVYKETFTEEELNELVAFYQSPIGQKIIAETPVMMRRSLERIQATMGDSLREMETRLLCRLEELKKARGERQSH
jgi:hypothetical protein